MTLTTEQVEASRQFMAAASRVPTLFDLEDQAYALMAALDDVHDESDNPELEMQLALVDQMLLEKTESYVSVIRSLEAMADARKAEADRLRERAKTAERHAEWLKSRLLAHMLTTGRSRIETARFTLTIRDNPYACVVLDAAAVPSDYQRTKIEISVDRRSILEDYKKTGEIPPGVEIARSQRLSVA